MPSSTLNGALEHTNENFKNKFPLPASLHFVPGGSVPTNQASHRYYLNNDFTGGYYGNGGKYGSNNDMQKLLKELSRMAGAADMDLKNISDANRSQCNQSEDCIFLPSLSVLSEAVFHPLSGCVPSRAKDWADGMVLSYYQQFNEESTSYVMNKWNLNGNKGRSSLVTLLKELSENTKHMCVVAPRPCGYVFKRGDMAWNCRTCQTDPTCVLCDSCFQASDHVGHEVSFHQTSPGGCCDCGDIEAWAVNGCCDKHRPIDLSQTSAEKNVSEAISASQKARKKGEEMANTLPPYLKASLGIVIGAAVHAIVEAIDGAGIGADFSQWRLRWAEEICKLRAGCVHDDDAKALLSNDSNKMIDDDEYLNPQLFLEEGDIILPERYTLDLRLHNDDVHTFDEVIAAMHPRRRRDNNHVPNEQEEPFVNNEREAEEMTQQVDSDGQVTVKKFIDFKGASTGFQRLKSKGLLCATVSTAQVCAENRAKSLLTWLADISSAHPGVSALVCHALVDVSGGDELFAGVHVWLESRQIPSWAGTADYSKRFQSFPAMELSSFLTREQARSVYKEGTHIDTIQGRDDFALCTGSAKLYYHDIPWNLPNRKLKKSPHSLWGVVSTPKSKRKYKNRTSISTLWSSTFPPVSCDRLLLVDTDTCKHQQADPLLETHISHDLPGLYAISGVATGINMISPDLIQHILTTSSFRSPPSPLLFMLLLDPYPPKGLRSLVHSLFLSLMIDLRFKSRFAAALGSVAYRPLSTLFCAGVGTEADTPLGFSVQIFTTGSLVQAMRDRTSIVALLESDNLNNPQYLLEENDIYSSYALPIHFTITRAVHSNLLGSSEEVKMLLKPIVVDDERSSILSPLLYQRGEHPEYNCLPAARDDEFLESRSTKHKRLPHILKDLQYTVETPGTAYDLLCGEDKQDVNKNLFPAVWARLMRMAQEMNKLKRKTSGGHIEYENRERWLDAFKLSLNLAGTRDSLCASIVSNINYFEAQNAICSLVAALLREIKFWLYGEGFLETGLRQPTGERSVPQRSTLHATNLQLDCARQVRILESQFIEVERAVIKKPMQEWLRVPHSPYGGDALSFHLPLHRSVAKSILTMCAIPISLEEREKNEKWWHVPLLDDPEVLETILSTSVFPDNCIVIWQNSANEQIQSEQMQRQVHVAVKIATAKVLHSLADHPLRCIAASMQIERHIWPRNGLTVLQMAIHYGTLQLCRSFRDLDLLLLQFVAAKSSHIILQLIFNRFNMENFLCDLQRNRGETSGTWIKPPSLHDMEHAPILAESIFTTLCHLVTELPPPPPTNEDDEEILERVIKRELIHALATEAYSYSEASNIALSGIEVKTGDVPKNFSNVFSRTLKSIAVQKSSGGSNSAPQWTLKLNSHDVVNEYDPTFWHLSRQEHQSAMETIASMRKNIQGNVEDMAYPIVQNPPKCHPRFSSARDILHTDGIDAALRRFLLYCVCGGDWFPSLSGNDDNEEKSNPTDKHIQSTILEIVQILTLQIHTTRDVESLLDRLIFIPSSLEDCDLLALSRMSTAGSGRNRTSILGLVIALFEHGYNVIDAQANGARSLVASGLKWYLRCIWYLSCGCDLSFAKSMAVNGSLQHKDSANEIIRGMLSLSGLWIAPKSIDEDTKVNDKARKKAQLRAMQRMKALQQTFVTANNFDDMSESEDEEETCIICRLGKSNGCLGYLGHLQSSRVAVTNGVRQQNCRMVVVGPLGCQLRQEIGTDSPKVALLPTDSVVELLSHNEIHQKRVKVRLMDSNIVGYASMHMQGGRPILSYLDEAGISKWGFSRPVLKMCGHVAHTSCVEAHTLSLHQRHAADLPFDGRYAVNLEQGEFLCPFCKRLCNVVCPIVPAEPPNPVKATGGNCILRIQDHLSGIVATQSPDKDISSFSSRILSILRMDGALINLTPILGACLGYSAYHNVDNLYRLHDTLKPSICAHIDKERDISKILNGTSLQNVTRSQLRYLARQWCHLGGIEVSKDQHNQWRKSLEYLLLSGEPVELPEWVRGLTSEDRDVASVWKYMPILSWDLTALAGILFSTISRRSVELARDIATTLSCARLIQILTLPHKFMVVKQASISENNVSKISQADLSVIQKYQTEDMHLSEIEERMIPFLHVISNVLRFIFDITDLPPTDQVWDVLKCLGSLPSSYDEGMVTQWRNQMTLLHEGLELAKEQKVAKIIEVTKPSPMEAVELASPSSDDENDLDVHMDIDNEKQNIMHVTGFLSTPRYDISYLGLKSSPQSRTLIKLPSSFVTLYSSISNMQVLSQADDNGFDSHEDSSDDEYSSSSGREIAICMITGKIILAGSRSRTLSYSPKTNPGRCTIHSRKNGAGVGIFFLLQKCAILLVHNDKSAYSPSLYVDENGEEDVGLRRGRPLFLLDERFQRLERLWSKHEIPGEVARIRSTSDRVIRDNWY